MKIASTDVTYCTNKKCERNCWRKVENYKFNDKEFYWFMDSCENIKTPENPTGEMKLTNLITNNDNHIPHID